MGAARAVLESLLRDRKLDVTLTSERPWVDPEDAAAIGIPQIDEALGGGLRRGHLSEIVGSRSSGRTTVMCAALAAATQRGEVAAVIDSYDRFDPASAADAGVDLSRVLWVRERGDAARALKATNLVLQAGGFGLVVFDMADVPASTVRQFPHTTWMRIARVIQGSQTTALLVASEHIGRSPGGATIALNATGKWMGESARARVLSALNITPRVATAHSHVGTSHVGTSHVGTSHVGTSHVGTSHVGTSHVARRTSHVARDTSHVARDL
jgi:recombination protein RecA